MRFAASLCLLTLAGCGLVLEADTARGQGGDDAGLRDGSRGDASMDASGDGAGATDGSMGMDAIVADASATDGGRGEASVADAMLADVVSACGPALEITTTPPFDGRVGLGTFVYDADSTATTESWALLEFPEGMTIGASTGLIEWDPPGLGSFPVEIEVTDPCSRIATQSFTIRTFTGLLNGLSSAAVHQSALSAPVRMQALARTPLASTSPPSGRDSQALLSAIVRCALPAGAELEVGSTTLRGEAGLAPEWSEEPCDDVCRAAVSACVLALVNPSGVRVPIAFETAPGLVWEGRYAGDLFADPPVAQVCRGDAPASVLGTRTCVLGDDRCPTTAVGPCDGSFGDGLDVWISAADSTALAPSSGRSAAP